MKTQPRSVYFILGVLALMACDRIKEGIVLKHVINNTPYQVSIKVYTTEETHQFDIQPLDTLILTGKCYFGPLEHCDSDWTYSFSRSELIFDGVKILRLSDECADGVASIAWDPFECAGYEQMDVQNDTRVYIYRITETDYEAAVPIED